MTQEEEIAQEEKGTRLSVSQKQEADESIQTLDRLGGRLSYYHLTTLTRG